MRLPSIKPVCAFLLMASVNSFAAEPAPLQQSNMSLNLANALVDATMSACHSQGRSAVAAVIDRGGHLLSLQRDDSVGPHNTDAAIKKAFTSSMEGKGSSLVEIVATCNSGWKLPPVKANKWMEENMFKQYPKGDLKDTTNL